MKPDEKYVIGIDYGTDSVRAVVIDAANGAQAGIGVGTYRRWADGKYCDPRENRFRQHPLDYIEGLETAVRSALAEAGEDSAGKIAGLTIDTTGSTPCFVDGSGRPLALDEKFSEDPDAMFILWKDHTAIGEAARINNLARNWGGADFTAYEGGVYSSEWFWSKTLHIAETNERVSTAASSVMEHADWMPALLTGASDCRAIRRNRCAAGHKAMWHASWGGYPSSDFLIALNPRLLSLAESLGTETWTTDTVIGTLAPEWAAKLGLSPSVVVSAGLFDASAGAVGGGIVPGTMLKIMGTSTCDMLIGPRPLEKEKVVRGICGQVDGSIIPGFIGYEAGQSAFGDIFAWFRKLISWPSEAIPGLEASRDITTTILSSLEEAAQRLPPGSLGITALDWLNGRRTPDANQSLKGALMGLSLGSDAPMVYRAPRGGGCVRLAQDHRTSPRRRAPGRANHGGRRSRPKERARNADLRRRIRTRNRNIRLGSVLRFGIGDIRFCGRGNLS